VSMSISSLSYKIMFLKESLEKDNSLSRKLKLLAAVCLFFWICICFGTKDTENMIKGNVVVTNIYWLVSVIALIGIFIKDSAVRKRIKRTELEIYDLEAGNIRAKKTVANVTGAVLPDYIEEKEIVPPDKKIYLPYVYYGILLAINLVTRLYLFVNNGV